MESYCLGGQNRSSQNLILISPGEKPCSLCAHLPEPQQKGTYPGRVDGCEGCCVRDIFRLERTQHLSYDLI